MPFRREPARRARVYRSATGPYRARPVSRPTVVTLVLSLCVLVLLAIPLTWRRVVLVGAMLAGFVLLFPVPAVRRFYALDLPRGELGLTLLVGALGAAALTGFWIRTHRHSASSNG
jgi:cation-transporting ATPase E